MGAVSTVSKKTKSGVGYVAHAYNPRTWRQKGLLWVAGLFIVTYLVVISVLSFYWGQEPDLFDVRINSLQVANAGNPDNPEQETRLVPGFVTTATAIRIAETLLYKPGGYLSNDITPPGVIMDNIPNWEFGALVQLRDLVRSMRNYFSRARTQSVEDSALQEADPRFNFSNDSWILPSSESQYKQGIEFLKDYQNRLVDSNQDNANFYVRADNLREHFNIVAQRLGSLGQRLAAAVGQERFNIDFAGERSATATSDTQSENPAPSASVGKQRTVKTSWWEIDDVFYEARGATWALIHILKALQIDFTKPLADKNAEALLSQIIRELEGAQAFMWSPMVLNGTGFGYVANHSLVMASYVSRANTAMVDMLDLLRQG